MGKVANSHHFSLSKDNILMTWKNMENFPHKISLMKALSKTNPAINSVGMVSSSTPMGKNILETS